MVHIQFTMKWNGSMCVSVDATASLFYNAIYYMNLSHLKF